MIDRARILVTGAGGMLGSYVDFGIRTTRASLDITARESVDAFVRERGPVAILHLAAETDLDACERDPAHAYLINAIGTHNVASAARAVGATMIYVSTDAVFRGDKGGLYTETDQPDPLSTYGRSKYLGEIIVQNMNVNHLIARTSWVFGGGPAVDSRFVGKIIAQLDSPRIEALDDFRSSPTYGKDVIEACLALLDRNARGIFHIANSGVGTRFEMAERIVHTLRPSTTVKAVQGNHFASLAKRGRNTALISTKYPMRPWQDALTEYLEKEWRPYLARTAA